MVSSIPCSGRRCRHARRMRRRRIYAGGIDECPVLHGIARAVVERFDSAR
ncbi:MAG: hypothetical protein WA215_00715 [Candidatus Cybelea sp.]